MSVLRDFFAGKDILPYDKHYFKDLTEIILVKNGVKNVCLLAYEQKYFDREYKELKEFAEENGLKLKIYHVRNEYTSKDISYENEIHIALYREEYEFGALDDKEYTTKNNPTILGYPDCCVEKMYNDPVYDYMNSRFDELCDSTERTSLPYVTNPFMMRTPFHIIVHRPCSLECKETLKQGIRNIKIIMKENIYFARKLRYLNKKIFLFIYRDNLCLIFDGIFENGRICYKKVLHNGGDMELENIKEKFKKGDSFIMKDNIIIIEKNKTMIDKIHLYNYKLFNFY